MGALSNSSSRLAYLAGMYKGLQSAGAAIMFRLDSWEKPYMTLFISNWVLLPVSLIIALPVAYYKVHETTIDTEEEAQAAAMGSKDAEEAEKTVTHDSK